jgi:V/A-type H+-transporting ATPase subunit F
VILMHKIAVLGEGASVLGFTALGLAVFPVESGEEAVSTFKHIVKSNEQYAIIYVTEKYAVDLADEIAKYKDSISPAVILIPGAEGSGGLGKAALQAAVERAVGADIL